MLPGTLMRQIYADSPPCGEMRNTKLHGVAYPDFITPAFFGYWLSEICGMKSLYPDIRD